MPNEQYNFTESKYIEKIEIDFENLPYYVIREGIIWKFESKTFANNGSYYKWQQELFDFINTIPNQHSLKLLIKGLEYGKKVYKYHLENECKNLLSCPYNSTWERRIAITEAMLEELRKQLEPATELEPTTTEKNKEFTTARQVLAMHFIFEQLQVRATEVDRSSKAKFVEFLTSKNYKNVYDALENPFITKDKKFRLDDLKFIRNFFESLGLHEIVKAINNQLDKPL